MTPKERIQAAMNLQPVDKIPVMCQFSIGHMLQQLKVSPVYFWFDQQTFAEGLIQLRDIYDFDGILISLHGHDPNWKQGIKEITKTNEAEVVEWKNGDKTICPFNDLPYYEFKNPESPPDISAFELSQLPAKLNYIPVSQNLHFKIDEEHKFDIIHYINEKCGDKYSIHGEITSPFDYLLDFLGHQEALISLIDYPGKCKTILSHFTKLIKNLAEEMCSAGVDAIKISSPFAGAGFISPEDYSEFVLPFESEIAHAIRNKGIHVYTHTCGAINDRLELMFDAGVSGIECLDPAPIGNVEIEDAVERIGSKGFIKGNIDSVNLLLNGSEEEILSELKKRIEIGKNKKGLILSTACSIAPAVKRENILLFRKAVEKWGQKKN